MKMVERRSRRDSPGQRRSGRSSSYDAATANSMNNTSRQNIPQSPSNSERLGMSSSSLDTSMRSLGSRGSLCDEAADDCDSINVVVRCRPLNPKELKRGDEPIVDFPGEGQIWVNMDNINGQATQKPKVFTYNVVFEPEAIQDDIVEHSGVKRLLDMALDGFCCTIFCYGQTGSGKTHTLTGPPYLFDSEHDLYSEDHGLIFRSFVYLFNQLQNYEDREFVIKASYLEIYNEKVIDLLNIGTNSSRPLQVRWSKKQRGFFVENLFSIECAELDDLLAVLEEGLRNRAVASHNMNEFSSRSHTILTVYITSEQKAEDGVYITKNGKINFVDLAGSEMTKKTNSEGKTLEEANNINKSLMVLGTCISALSDSRKRDGHIPYRDSKLTKLLADSLSGSGVTLMIACVSPARSNLSETLNTLRYAARAKRIRTKPIIVMDPKEKVIMNLQSELKLLQEENSHLKMLLAIGAAQNNGIENGSANGNEVGKTADETGASIVPQISLSRQGSFRIDKEKLDQLDNSDLINLLTHYMNEHQKVRKENKELQKVTTSLVRDQELVSKENERLHRKLEDLTRYSITPTLPISSEILNSSFNNSFGTLSSILDSSSSSLGSSMGIRNNQTPNKGTIQNKNSFSRSEGGPPESSQVWVNPINDHQRSNKNEVASAPSTTSQGRMNNRPQPLPDSINKELERRRIGKSMTDLTARSARGDSGNTKPMSGRRNSLEFKDQQNFPPMSDPKQKTRSPNNSERYRQKPKPKRSQSVPRTRIAADHEGKKPSKLPSPQLRKKTNGRLTATS